MSGYFYAFDDVAECGQEASSVWSVDAESEEPILVGATLVSTRGIFITKPGLIEDAGGELVIDPGAPGARSLDYVILTSAPILGAEAYLIEPEGRQGFA